MHYKQNDTVWFTSLVNEHPEQWYTTVTMGFKDALAKGLTQRGEGGEAGSLGGFRGLFLQEHVRTRTTAGTRGSQHRLYWGGLRNPNHAVARSSALRETGLCARGILEQVTWDRVFYLEVLRVVASLGTPDCKGFSQPELLSGTCAPPFAMVSTSRRSATRSDGFGSLASFGRPCSARAHAQDPDVVVSEWLRYGCLTGIGESVIEANGIFPPTSGPSSATSRVGAARTTATTPLSTRAPQRSRRTKSRGSSTKDSSRRSPRGSRSRKDGPRQSRARWPCSS